MVFKGVAVKRSTGSNQASKTRRRSSPFSLFSDATLNIVAERMALHDGRMDLRGEKADFLTVCCYSL
jgi:hypothetical protein